MTFPIGEFAKNTIHGYITFLLAKTTNNVDNNLFSGLILKNPMSDYEKAIWLPQHLKGVIRLEVLPELEIVTATSELIKIAKEELPKLIMPKILDNLTYIELLNMLNDKEKVLKNENKI